MITKIYTRRNNDELKIQKRSPSAYADGKNSQFAEEVYQNSKRKTEHRCEYHQRDDEQKKSNSKISITFTFVEPPLLTTTTRCQTQSFFS